MPTESGQGTSRAGKSIRDRLVSHSPKLIFGWRWCRRRGRLSWPRRICRGHGLSRVGSAATGENVASGFSASRPGGVLSSVLQCRFELFAHFCTFDAELDRSAARARTCTAYPNPCGCVPGSASGLQVHAYLGGLVMSSGGIEGGMVTQRRRLQAKKPVLPPSCHNLLGIGRN